MNSDLDLIWGYIEGELTEEEINGVERRLKSDPAFQRLFSEQNEIYQSLRKTDVIAFRRKLKQLSAELRKDKPTDYMILMSYPWLIAAAIGFLCLTTGYFLFRSTAGENTPPPVISTVQKGEDSLKAFTVDTLSVDRIIRDGSATPETVPGSGRSVQSENELFAESFTINPLLEELTHIHYRSGSLKRVIPENGQIFSSDSPIIFTCQIEPSDSVALTILDNRSLVSLVQVMPSGEYAWQPPHQKGLYYFQLSRDKKLLCTRKFYIR